MTPIVMQLTEVNPADGAALGEICVNLAEIRTIKTRSAPTATRSVTTITFPTPYPVYVKQSAHYIASVLGDFLATL